MTSAETAASESTAAPESSLSSTTEFQRDQETVRSSTEAQHIPNKIPPPPTELPPPYTPFITYASPLLQSDQSQVKRGGNQPRQTSVRARGVSRYVKYITPLNLLIAFITLIALCVFVYVIHKSNASDEDIPELLEEKISFDELRNSIVLSEYDSHAGQLKSEVKNLNDHLSLFDFYATEVTDKYSDCMRFTEQVYCCSTPVHSHHHKTDCWYTADDGNKVHSVAMMYDFVPNWQSLDDGEKLLLIHNRQRNAILDLKHHKIFKIEENLLPHGYYSMAFFFPMDTADELDELIRKEDEFRIWFDSSRQIAIVNKFSEYLKEDTGDYALKDKRCQPTAFKVDSELKKVQFCTNSLYTAVVQYGHLSGESDVLTWRLRVKYDSAKEVFSATESLESRVEQVAIDWY